MDASNPWPPGPPGVEPVAGISETAAVAVPAGSMVVGEVAGVSFSPPVLSEVAVADGVGVSVSTWPDWSVAELVGVSVGGTGVFVGVSVGGREVLVAVDV
jgi:hypothetical protein